MMFDIALGISVFLCSVQVQCWDLKTYGISNTYFASSVAVFKNRAFLALSRSVCHNNLTNPTLIEVPWTGDNAHRKRGISQRIVRFPSSVEQNWGRCDQLQDAAALDIDPEAKYGRLWVLDKGNKKCGPKILAYNLRLNGLIFSTEFPESKVYSPNSIVVDVRSKHGPVAFIGLSESSHLVVFWYKWKSWSTLNLERPASTDFLALDFNTPLLYLKGSCGDDLFTMNTTLLLDSVEQGVGSGLLKYEGKLLGSSTGIVVDLKGGLDYYLIRDYVIVRWDTGKPLTAENHQVLVQSYDALPYVSQLFNDNKGNVWALVNPLGVKECSNPKSFGSPISRVVMIMRYRGRGKLNVITKD